MLRSSFLYCLLLLCLFFSGSCQDKSGKPHAAIEIIDNDYRVSVENFKKFCVSADVDISDLYCWENHYLVYTDVDRVESMVALFQEKYPKSHVKVYDKPFYIFDRKTDCGQQKVKAQKHIIYTANLVADTTLQREYMDYHTRQFTEWPDVSRGFCNAGFQSVSVYRSGRQLLLVISIPAGADYEKLNARTTENNPKMIEWNQIMSGYQEGVEGAPVGVVWGRFEPQN